MLEYQALIGTLTVRWQELQSQFQDFQKKEKSSADLVIMGGPDFVTRVNKLREAISSVSRQLHCPPLNLKHYEQLSGQEDSLKVKTKNTLEIVNWSVLHTRPVRLTTPACDPQFAPVNSAGSPFLIGIVTLVQAENFDLKEAKSDALNDPPMSRSCGVAKPFGLSSRTKEKKKWRNLSRALLCHKECDPRDACCYSLDSDVITCGRASQSTCHSVRPPRVFFFGSWLVFTALSLFIVTHPRRSSRLWPRSRTTWIHCTRRKTMRSTPRRRPNKKSRSSASWTNCATSGHCSTRLTLTNKGNARSQCYASCCWAFYFGKERGFIGS